MQSAVPRLECPKAPAQPPGTLGRLPAPLPPIIGFTDITTHRACGLTVSASLCRTAVPRATDRPLTLWWNQHHVSACFSDVLIIGWSDLQGYGLRTTPCGDFLTRFNRFDYVFDSTDFRPPGDLGTRGFRSVPFRLLPAFVILGDEDIASEVRSQRFIISDLSDIFISDIFISDIFILPVH